MVTPSSSNRLSAARNSVTPFTVNACSPGPGAGATLKSAASPEHPPGVTFRRKPLPGPPSKRSRRRMNFSAAAVMVRFIDRPSGSRLIAREVGVNDTGIVHRTDRDALRDIEIPDAFGALLRIDDER